jgi:hypothetical protein
LFETLNNEENIYVLETLGLKYSDAEKLRINISKPGGVIEHFVPSFKSAKFCRDETLRLKNWLVC